ncbi:MAG: 3-carboxy-cis,cis-muconate cycloisomerase, partial [Alphaproteobacteria bacterium]|nr:3-carboxy-cis,cis-muconate cycloisomerase [Alphaproteobacteria bacterium]
MTADPFSAPSHGELFVPAAIRTLLSDERRVAEMVRMEVALARANAKCGVIPETAARTIEGTLGNFTPDFADLGIGTGAAGVPVPALVAQLREAVGGSAADYLHWGATSQDVLDTALVLILRDLLDCLDDQLAALIDSLARLAHQQRSTVMLARTRMQQAVPTTFGVKVAGWRQPLLRSRDRLSQLRPRLLSVQLGGAAGTLAPWAGIGTEVRQALADELNLHVLTLPWHTQRDGLAEFAGWLSLVTGGLGTIGLNVGLLAQNEIGEVAETSEAGLGGSSTLPQKCNPIHSEILVALARYNASAIASMHQALLHEGERSGAAWSLEWLTLPAMALAAGGALAHARELITGLVVDAARMRQNLEATGGLCLAEAATFALAAHMPRAQAQALVGEACREAKASGQRLVAVLERQTDAPVQWSTVDDPEQYLGSAVAL